ncbi:MAG: hypothetical protein ABI026_04610, partial [Gemmatimonadaceae bacterium]
EPAPQEPATPAPVAAASESWEHRADTGADRTWGARTATESAHTPPPTSPSTEPTAEGHRRSINPFLTRDPALRAKRLARALVSDIVAYHPARHAEGLRDGTLKTLFRDEIKKSYEEYVDQVGRDFASTTTHFQDALNDVLASGKKLF